MVDASDSGGNGGWWMRYRERAHDSLYMAGEVVRYLFAK